MKYEHPQKIVLTQKVVKRILFLLLAIAILTASIALFYYQRHTTQIRQTEAIRQFVRDENKEEWVLGKTEAELRELFGDIRRVSGLLKHLHPYCPPKGHDLLLLDDTYIVFELKDGMVIKVHKISG